MIKQKVTDLKFLGQKGIRPFSCLSVQSPMNRMLTIILFSILSTHALADNLGKITYQHACSNCHSPRLANGMRAPAAFDKQAWNARFKKAKIESRNNPQRYKSPLDYLLSSVIKGKNLMHHGGLCHESSVLEKNCSNEAYIQAIEYMSGRDID